MERLGRTLKKERFRALRSGFYRKPTGYPPELWETGSWGASPGPKGAGLVPVLRQEHLDEARARLREGDA